MILISSIFLNRTPAAQSAAAGGRSASGFRFDAMIQAATEVETVSPAKNASSGVRYSRAW
jgi:hypothetical protein